MGSHYVIVDNFLKPFDVKIVKNLNALTFLRRYKNWQLRKVCSRKYFSNRKLVEISRSGGKI